MSYRRTMRFLCSPPSLRREYAKMRGLSSLRTLTEGNPYAEAFAILSGHVARNGYELKVRRLGDGVFGECRPQRRSIYIARRVPAGLRSGELTPADVIYILAHETAHIHTCRESSYTLWQAEVVADMVAVRICQSFDIPLSQVTYYEPLERISEFQEALEGFFYLSLKRGPYRAATRRDALAVAEKMLSQSPSAAQPVLRSGRPESFSAHA